MDALKIELDIHIRALPENGGVPVCWYDTRTVTVADMTTLAQAKNGLVAVLCEAVSMVQKIGG